MTLCIDLCMSRLRCLSAIGLRLLSTNFTWASCDLGTSQALLTGSVVECYFYSI